MKLATNLFHKSKFKTYLLKKIEFLNKKHKLIFDIILILQLLLFF